VTPGCRGLSGKLVHVQQARQMYTVTLPRFLPPSPLDPSSILDLPAPAAYLCTAVSPRCNTMPAVISPAPACAAAWPPLDRSHYSRRRPP
jgi:hypothetical protein